VKPSNLMLDEHARLWITDFGLARIQGDGASTTCGPLMGTLRYMSPEQALGNRGVVDQRSDVYSLGVTLYELLTLTPIFPGASHEELLSLIPREEPTLPRKLSPAISVHLETIILKAIAKDASDRFQTAKQFASELQRFLDGKPSTVRRPGAADRVAKWLRRHPAALGVVLTTVVASFVIGVLSVFYFFRLQQHIHERDMALSSARMHVYAQDVRQAAVALDEQDFGHAARLLERHRPEAGEADERQIDWHMLNRKLTGSGRTIQISEQRLTAVDYSPDGKYVATGGVDGDLVIFETVGWTEIYRIRTPHGGINDVQFSPDSKSVATAGDDHSARIWSISDGKQSQVVTRPEFDDSSRVCFSPDGIHLVTCWRNEIASVWNLQIGNLVADLKGHSRTIVDIDVSPDGKRIATVSSDLTAALYELKTGTRLDSVRLNEKEDERLTAVGFSKDGLQIVISTIYNNLYVWEPSKGAKRLAAHGRDQVQSVAFLPSDRVVTADRSGTVAIWDVGSPDAKLVAGWHVHKGRANCVSVRSPTEVASVGEDGTLRILDIRADGVPTVSVKLPPHIWHYRFTTADELVFTDVQSRSPPPRFAEHSGEAWIYNLEDGRVERFVNPAGRVANCADVSPDGRTVVLSNDHLQTEQKTVSFIPRGAGEQFQLWTSPSDERFDEIGFSPNGKWLFLQTLSESDGLHLIDWHSKSRVLSMPRHASKGEPEFSKSSRWLISRKSRTISLWDLHHQHGALRQFSQPEGIAAVAISPDETIFAAGGDSRTVSIFTLPDGNTVGEFIGHQAAVFGVCFSPDGNILFTSDLSGTVKVWHVPTQRFLFDLARHGRQVENISISPSGRYLAYAIVGDSIVAYDLQGISATN
jgi:eukaryotic-like serine/threonine-protein kinase